MTLNVFMFYLLSATILVFSLLTITSGRILRAAVYLLFVLIGTAGLYFLLQYQFLAAVQLAIYAGGIVVLIIFSILLTSHISHKFRRPSRFEPGNGNLYSTRRKPFGYHHPARPFIHANYESGIGGHYGRNREPTAEHIQKRICPSV